MNNDDLVDEDMDLINSLETFSLETDTTYHVKEMETEQSYKVKELQAVIQDLQNTNQVKSIAKLIR